MEIFTLLLLLGLLVLVGMSMGKDEGEVDREGIAGVLRDLRMAGLVGTRAGGGGVEERICTGSLSSSNAGCRSSQSILW